MEHLLEVITALQSRVNELTYELTIQFSAGAMHVIIENCDGEEVVNAWFKHEIEVENIIEKVLF